MSPTTEETREHRRRRYALRTEVDGRLVYQHTEIVHGTVSSYNNYGCRCGPCTEAHRIKVNTWRRAKR